MTAQGPEHAFAEYRSTGASAAFARFYDLTVGEVLAVAVRLAVDAAEAEDLVQVTYLAALEGKDRYDRAQRVVPWLVGICTHQAGKLHRTRRRDAALPRREERDPTDPVAAARRSELEEQLEASLTRLPDVYRPVLVLSLLHELTPTEIAKALGRPPVTVRSQLFRGLELLREALPRGIAFGALLALLPTRGLAAVREIVVAKAALVGGAVALAPVLGGGLLMKKLVVALLVTLLVCTGWLVWPREAFPSDVGPERQATHASLQSLPASRESLPTADLPRSEVRPATREQLASLRVQLVWKRDGAPATGIRGVVRERQRSAAHLFEREFETDAAGAFSCDDLLPGQIEVLTDRSNHFLVVVPGERAEKRIAIPEGLDVTVRVVDVEKRPIVGAEVWCSSDFHWAEGRVAGRTDARGIFVVRDLGRRRSLAARANGYEPAVTATLDGAPGERVTEEIVLERGGEAVRGTVRLANGRPAAGALVRVATNCSRQVDALRGGFHAPPPASYVRADAAGGFRADGLSSGLVTVSARSIAGGIASREVFVKVGAIGEVDLQVSEATSVRGSVRSSAGAPLPGVLVSGQWKDLGVFSRSETTTDPEGRFVLDGVPLGEVAFQASSGDSWVNHRAVVTTNPLDLELVIALPDANERIAGTVVTEDGTPCASWRIRSVPREGRTFQTSTDAQGAFRFLECPEPTTTLQVGGPDEGLFLPLLIREGVARGSGAVRIVVPRAKTVFGKLALRVLGPGGEPLARALVRVVPVGGERDLDRHTTSDGKVEYSKLPPGRYRVSVRAPGFGVVSLGVRELVDASGLDLGTIVLAPAVTLRARLEGPGLQALHPYAALYTREGEYIAPQSPRSTKGELVFEEVPPGEYVAQLGGAHVAVRTIPVVVGVGAEQVVVWKVEAGQEVTVQVSECTRLAECGITLLDPAGAIVFEFRSKCLDPDGSLVVGVALAAGTYTVRAEEAGGPTVERPLVVPKNPGPRVTVALALR